MKPKIAVAVLLLSLAAPALCQNPATEGITRGLILGNVLRDTRRTEAETELLREQTEMLRRQRQALEAAEDQSTGPRVTTAEFNKAWTSLQKRYPDLLNYRVEMARLVKVFRAGDVAVEDYMEGLYLLAKYAAFSQAPPEVKKDIQAATTEKPK